MTSKTQNLVGKLVLGAGLAGLLGACATSGTQTASLGDKTTAHKMLCIGEAALSERCSGDRFSQHRHTMRGDMRKLEAGTGQLRITSDARAVPNP